MKSTRNWVTAAFLLLTFYTAGGGTVESFVNYPTWLMIGQAEFKAYHHALGPRVAATRLPGRRRNHPGRLGCVRKS